MNKLVEKAQEDASMMIDIVGMDESTQAVIITGNPVDGFSFIGPFQDGEKAHEYVGRHVRDDWYVASLDTPQGN